MTHNFKFKRDDVIRRTYAGGFSETVSIVHAAITVDFHIPIYIVSTGGGYDFYPAVDIEKNWEIV